MKSLVRPYGSVSRDHLAKVVWAGIKLSYVQNQLYNTQRVLNIAEGCYDSMVPGMRDETMANVVKEVDKLHEMITEIKSCVDTNQD